METHHLIGFYVFCTGPHYDERFTDQEREIILEAAQYATDWHHREGERSEAEYRSETSSIIAGRPPGILTLSRGLRKRRQTETGS
jgi:hypothetical protein